MKHVLKINKGDKMNVTKKDLTLNQALSLVKKGITRVIMLNNQYRIDFD